MLTEIIGAKHIWIVHSWQSQRIDNVEYLILYECNNLPVKSMKAYNYFSKSTYSWLSVYNNTSCQ